VKEKLQVFDCTKVAGARVKEEIKRWVRGENFTRRYFAFAKLLKWIPPLSAIDG
jgi:hypothetical protein